MIRKAETLATTVLGCLLLSTAALEPVQAQRYVISTIVGETPQPPPTPVRGVDLTIGYPRGIATDSSGNAYFTSDTYVFKLDQNGIATRIAGNPGAGYPGDGGPATSARLNFAAGIAVDAAGNLFVVDNFCVIRKISPSGIITTVAGNGTPGFSGDGGPATSAQLYQPSGVAVDGAGNLFISEVYNRVRKVSPDGIITTVAGNGAAGYSGDGGPAAVAQLANPTGVAVDGAGNLFIVDAGNRRIRKLSRDGTISTIAGDGTFGSSGDGGPATSAQLTGANSVAVDGAGNLFITELYSDDCDTDSAFIRKVSPSGVITTVANVEATGVAVDGAGNLFIVRSGFQVVVKVSPSGIITTVAGPGKPSTSDSGDGDGGPATNARLNGAVGVALDGAGNLFIADSNNSRVRKVSPSGIITTVAGNGTRGSSGDGGPATSAQLFGPTGVAVDAAGNLFVADGRIRKVSPTGIITTVVVAGIFGYGVAVDGAGNLFIAALSEVLKVSPSGIITTVAGGANQRSSGDGDGGPATSALLNQATGVVVDGAGNLFISEVYGYRVRKVSPDGIITTVAGNGIPGHSGDGGPATSAQLNTPIGVALDRAGNLLIVDFSLRRVSPDGIITTVPGAGGEGVAVDGAGNIYLAFGDLVRVLRPTNQSVFIDAVVDAASQSANPISPGKIVVIYGTGLGPTQLVQNQPSNGLFGTAVGGTAVSFNGIAAPILYTSATQVAVVAPYAVSGTTAQVTVTYQGQASAAVAIPVAPSAPSLFTLNETGSGQATAINADGTVNTAANPVKIGASIILYATGEGQTSPVGVDGKVGGSSPILPVTMTIGGVQAAYSTSGAPGQVSGLMRVTVQIPTGVQPGGYVPVVLQVGDASTTPGAVWIAVSGN